MTDNETVSVAQKRERLREFLSAHPGEHPVAEIAQATGISRGAAGQLLANMAKGKLLKVNGKLYSWPQNGVVTEVAAPKRAYVRKPKAVDMPDNGFELAMNGNFVIGVTRAPSGRIRFTFSQGE